MKHVISTLAADNKYTAWKSSAGLNMPDYSVLVKGGAGVAVVGGQIIDTPQGVRTEVTDRDAEFLESHPQFIQHRERGFVKIINAPKDPEVAAKNMATDDGSRPKTPEDVKKAADAAKKDDGSPPLQAIVNKTK